MKYNKEKAKKVFAFLLASIFSAHAFSLINHVNAKDNDKSIQKRVVVSQQAETHIAERKVQYDKWLLQCFKGKASGNEKCNLIYQLNNNKKQSIIRIEVLKTGDTDVMLFYLPLGIYLPAGMVLIVGESEYKVPITSCIPAGCRAQIELDWSLNQQLKHEEKAAVQLLSANQKQKINISFSLAGYLKGFKKLK
jgi:invasion protein IalB